MRDFVTKIDPQPHPQWWKWKRESKESKLRPICLRWRS